MAIKFSQYQRQFICSDAERVAGGPTQASHDGLPKPMPGDTLWVYDTNILYKTKDGTTWTLYITLA